MRRQETEGVKQTQNVRKSNVIRIENKTWKHNTGTQWEKSPTRQRLATSRQRTLRSRQRCRHEAYGAGAKPCD